MFKKKLGKKDLTLLQQQLNVARMNSEFPDICPVEEKEEVTLLHKLCALKCDNIESQRTKEKLTSQLLELLRTTSSAEVRQKYLNTKRPNTHTTALHHAVRHGMKEVIPTFVSLGADPTQRNSRKGGRGGRSPFILAIHQQEDDIAMSMAVELNELENERNIVKLFTDRDYNNSYPLLSIQLAYHNECIGTFSWLLYNALPYIQEVSSDLEQASKYSTLRAGPRRVCQIYSILTQFLPVLTLPACVIDYVGWCDCTFKRAVEELWCSNGPCICKGTEGYQECRIEEMQEEISDFFKALNAYLVMRTDIC